MSSGTIRIGILGTARIAPQALIDPARQIPEVEVAAVASRDRQRAERFAQKCGIPRCYGSYAELVDDPQIDALYIPLPVAFHAEWSIRALEQGKHVLCEKPIAANASEAEQMAEAARRAGRVICEAMHYRYHPVAARIKEIVTSGELGRLKHVEAHLCVPIIFNDSLRYSYELGGGAVMDVGCYAINVCRLLAGQEPEVIKADARLSSPQVDRWMRAELRFPNGCSGTMVCSIFSPVLLRSQAKAVGEKGRMDVLNPYAPQTFFHAIKVRSADSRRTEKLTKTSTYQYQLQAFFQAIRHGQPLPTGPEDFLANMRVIDAVYEKAGLRPRGMSPEA